MLQRVQGRIKYVKKDLVHQGKRIPPGNQENTIEGKKKGGGGVSVLEAFGKIQQQGSIKELTIILRLIVWRLELKVTGRIKE